MAHRLLEMHKFGLLVACLLESPKCDSNICGRVRRACNAHNPRSTLLNGPIEPSLVSVVELKRHRSTMKVASAFGMTIGSLNFVFNRAKQRQSRKDTKSEIKSKMFNYRIARPDASRRKKKQKKKNRSFYFSLSLLAHVNVFYSSMHISPRKNV